MCSFVPADPLLPDNSQLWAGRRNSQLPELFHDWAEYRLARVGHKALRLAQASFDGMLGVRPHILYAKISHNLNEAAFYAGAGGSKT